MPLSSETRIANIERWGRNLEDEGNITQLVHDGM